MLKITQKNLLLALIGIGSKGITRDWIGGITRIQKFLFLLEKEEKIIPGDKGYEFIPYKVGPFSTKIYDGLEFLENLGFVKSETAGGVSEEEAVELEKMSFEELMDDNVNMFEDNYEEKKYKITRDGFERIKNLVEREEYNTFLDGIRRIKSKYGHYSLSDLLYYVYTKYPEAAIESEIKEKVLKQRRK